MPLTVVPTRIPDVLRLAPNVYRDERGFLVESHNDRDFRAATGLDVRFVQDNHSRSTRGILRGLHYQLVEPQGKLVRVTRGRIFDVAVDLRRSSPTFGQWVGETLSDEDHHQLWIPAGFAHGFLTLSEETDVVYKMTGHRAAEHERVIRWDDPDLAIAWPAGVNPRLGARDRDAGPFATAEAYP